MTDKAYVSPGVQTQPKMTNQEYTSAVERGEYPADPTVPIDEPFVNHNGSILNLLTAKFTHSAILTSPQGVVRANHYHKTDWHYTYVINGCVTYFWCPVGDILAIQSKTFPAGTMFFSPPMVEHAMFFEGDQNAIVTFAKNERSIHETHEADLVRVPLIKPVWNGSRFMPGLDPLKNVPKLQVASLYGKFGDGEKP